VLKNFLRFSVEKLPRAEMRSYALNPFGRYTLLPYALKDLIEFVKRHPDIKTLKDEELRKLQDKLRNGELLSDNDFVKRYPEIKTLKDEELNKFLVKLADELANELLDKLLDDELLGDNVWKDTATDLFDEKVKREEIEGISDKEFNKLYKQEAKALAKTLVTD
jgi:hypothetical protein